MPTTARKPEKGVLLLEKGVLLHNSQTPEKGVLLLEKGVLLLINLSLSLSLTQFADAREGRTFANVCLRTISDMPTTARKPDPVVTQM